MLYAGNVRSIFFDVDETVFSVQPSVAYYYQRVLNRFTLEASEEMLIKALYQSWIEIKPYYENSANGYQTFPIREREIWREFSRRVLLKLSFDPKLEILDSLYEEFADGSTRIVKEGFLELITALHARNISTGLFTNNDSRIHSVLKGHNMTHLFSHVFTAADLGYKKPSPFAFKAIEAFTGFSSPQNLYVGNSIEHDYRGPTSAGWQAVICATSETHYKEVLLAAVPAVRSFNDLMKIFSEV